MKLRNCAVLVLTGLLPLQGFADDLSALANQQAKEKNLSSQRQFQQCLAGLGETALTIASIRALYQSHNYSRALKILGLKPRKFFTAQDQLVAEMNGLAKLKDELRAIQREQVIAKATYEHSKLLTQDFIKENRDKAAALNDRFNDLEEEYRSIQEREASIREAEKKIADATIKVSTARENVVLAQKELVDASEKAVALVGPEVTKEWTAGVAGIGTEFRLPSPQWAKLTKAANGACKAVGAAGTLAFGLAVGMRVKRVAFDHVDPSLIPMGAIVNPEDSAAGLDRSPAVDPDSRSSLEKTSNSLRLSKKLVPAEEGMDAGAVDEAAIGDETDEPAAQIDVR